MQSRESKELRITTRRVGRPGEHSTVELTVWCPRHDRRVFVDACVACGHCDGISFEPDGAGSLRCTWRHTADASPFWTMASPAAQSTATRIPVATVMSREVVTVRTDTTLETVMSVMLEKDLGGLPVVDDEDRPVGMVSKTDVLRLGHEADGWERARRWSELDGDSPEERLQLRELPLTAEDVMMPMVFMLPERAPLSMAAALMACERVHRLPIVNDAGHLAGLLSSLDIMRWLAQREGYAVPRRR